MARIYDPRASRDLPASRDTHGRHGLLDDRPGAPADASPGGCRRVEGPTGQLMLLEELLPDAWAGRKVRELVDDGQGSARSGQQSRRASPRRREPARTGRGRASHRRDEGRSPGTRSQVGNLARVRVGRRVGERHCHRMKVAICGAGNVGTSIATDLASEGHDGAADRQGRRPGGAAPAELEVTLVAADGCEVSSLDAAGLRERRRRYRGHRRRRGQSRHLAALQAGVRRSPRNRPGQQLEESVAFQRVLGRRRLCLHAAHDDGAGRRGGLGGLPRPVAAPRAGHANLVEVTLADESPAVGVSLAHLDIPTGCDGRRGGATRSPGRSPGGHRARAGRRGARPGHGPIREAVQSVLVGD